LARVEFGRAADKLREGESAFGANDISTAQQRYREALKGYELAKVEAARAAEKTPSEGAGSEVGAAAQRRRDLDEAQQARKATERARQEAEQATAPQLASKTFALAQQRERQGEASFGRQDFASAKGRFHDAQQGYKQAGQEAAVEQQRAAALQRQQAEAEQQRVATLQRQQAEAEQQARERATAALKSGGEQARGRTVARREEAAKAEAERLARDLFEAGQVKQTEADGLMARQNFTAAVQAYQDASERYVEAAMRAQGAREAKAAADGARTRMLAEKQRADQTTPEFGAAVAEERQAGTFYERFAYREATEKFRLAETLFLKAAAKPMPTQPSRGPEPPKPGSPSSPPSQPSRPRTPPPSF
jgi:hypothetical protein